MSVKELEILFPNINKGTNCKIFLWLHRLSPNPLRSYLQYEENGTCQQPRPRFAWILPIRNINVDQCSYSFAFMIWLWSWNILLILFQKNLSSKIWSKKNMGLYVPKMCFLQSRQMKVSGYNGVWYKNF